MNNLLFIFRAEDIKGLLEAGTDFIVIRSYLEEATLADGRKAGALQVYADAVSKGSEKPMASVAGCPNPPCHIN